MSTTAAQTPAPGATPAPVGASQSAAPPDAVGPAAPPARGTLSRLVRRPSSLFGLIVIALIVIAAVGAPLFAPWDPNEQSFDGLTIEGAPVPPNATYPFGTDLLGRDLLSRLLYGARTSLFIGIVANGIAVLIGATVGIVAGYAGGLARGGPDALHGPDDGVPGAAARDRARVDLRAERVDRGAGDRDGELGADGPRRSTPRPARSRSASSSPRRSRSARAGCACSDEARAAAPAVLDHRVRHARDLDDGAAGGHARLPRRRACSRRRRAGATSSSRTRPTSSPPPGWCSSPAR